MGTHDEHQWELRHMDGAALREILGIAREAKDSLVRAMGTVRHEEEPVPLTRDRDELLDELARLALAWDDIEEAMVEQLHERHQEGALEEDPEEAGLPLPIESPRPMN